MVSGDDEELIMIRNYGEEEGARTISCYLLCTVWPTFEVVVCHARVGLPLRRSCLP